MKLRDIFEIQYRNMSTHAAYRQHFVYIIKHLDGQKFVGRIHHWKVVSLLREYDYILKDQEGHILPVFTQRKKK